MALLNGKLKSNWNKALQIKSYRYKLFGGILLLIAILAFLPYFFGSIEKRNGKEMADAVLDWLPAADLSLPVFFLIWGSCGLLIYRLTTAPDIMIRILWAYNLLTLLRMISISLISLDPPANLIPLADPVTNLFYGRHHYITHDLFFSGHTASVALIFFCLKNKWDRILTGIATVLLAFFLLIQHVHYTVDVIAAPFFTWLMYRIALRMTGRETRLLTTG